MIIRRITLIMITVFNILKKIYNIDDNNDNNNNDDDDDDDNNN